MSCIEECLIVLNRHHTASFAFQRLPNGPEILWTRWWVHSQTSGRQQHRGLCETKQPTSCSVEPGRSFFGCSSVWTGHGRAGAWREQPEAMQRVQASTDVRLHSHTFTCTQLLFGAAHWVLPIDISSLWENILTRWQKEIMRENVPYSHKWCQILRLSMTDALNLGTNGY